MPPEHSICWTCLYMCCAMANQIRNNHPLNINYTEFLFLHPRECWNLRNWVSRWKYDVWAHRLYFHYYEYRLSFGKIRRGAKPQNYIMGRRSMCGHGAEISGMRISLHPIIDVLSNDNPPIALPCCIPPLTVAKHMTKSTHAFQSCASYLRGKNEWVGGILWYSMNKPMVLLKSVCLLCACAMRCTSFKAKHTLQTQHNNQP